MKALVAIAVALGAGLTPAATRVAAALPESNSPSICLMAEAREAVRAEGVVRIRSTLGTPLRHRFIGRLGSRDGERVIVEVSRFTCKVYDIEDFGDGEDRNVL